MEVDNVLEEESQVEWQSRSEVKTSQTELMKRDSPLSLNLSHLDAKPESNQHGCYEEQITDPSLAHLPCWGGPLDIGVQVKCSPICPEVILHFCRVPL